MSDDEHYMRRCLVLARQALARGEVPVGALVVAAGRILGEAGEATRTRHDHTAHAEALALTAACGAVQAMTLEGATLYSTVEPCLLCGYVARAARVARVVYGVPAGRLGACTSTYALLRDPSVAGWIAPPAVTAGVLADECRALLDARPARTPTGSAREPGPEPG